VGETMGLDVYLGYGKDGEHNRDSYKYPTHYFKIGYFRSAYNSWGLNSVLRRTIEKDLYYIFEPPDKKYEFKPKWLDCRMRCINVIEEFNEFINKLKNVAVMTISGRLYTEEGMPKNEKEATDMYTKLRDNDKDRSFRSFINRDGHFYLDGIRCFAFIPGKDTFEKDCTYVIYEPELTEGEKNELNPNIYKDYVRCLEIVLETIDYVLEQPASEIKKYKLRWSA